MVYIDGDENRANETTGTREIKLGVNMVKIINAKEAARKAEDYLCNLMPEISILEVKLEEVERKGKFWMITLSYPFQSSLIPSSLIPGKKEYKVFKVDGETGEVVSMKIHTVSEPSIA